MNERDLFVAALDIADPAERAAYLDRACAGSPALRRQVDELLAAHERSGAFLDAPALAPVTGGEPVGDETSAEYAGPREEIDLEFLETSTTPGLLGKLGHYEVQEVLGRGGCGIVLKARDEMLNRTVAIKVLAPELATTSPARRRFLREARAVAALRHDNVITIHHVDDKPIPYLVMEYIAGPTLQQKLDQTGPLDVREVLEIGLQIARGLDAAHAEGLIHRDIKPGNVLLESGRNRVKITDFGLARTADDASVTQSGVIAGTPLYMSPEQAQGHVIDQRSDLFSLGSVLYVMCSGRPPFRAASTLAVLKRVVEDQPRPIRAIIPEVPDWLSAIIDKLHAKQPADRFASAKEVADLLARCQDELLRLGRVQCVNDLLPSPPVAAKVEATSVPAWRPLRRRNRVAAAAVIAALLTGLGLSEATNVTNLRGTMIRLLSPAGTLVVEVDDPDISVTIDGADMIITGAGAREIRLRPGEYKVVASKDGKLLRQELVNVTRSGRQVVRVSREAEPPPVVPPVAAARPIARQPAFLRGNWRSAGDVIEQLDRNREALLLFGAPDFGDGDFSCEALRAEGDHGLALVARASDLENYYYFDVGVFKNSWNSLYAKEAGASWRRLDQQRTEPIPSDRWVKLRLRLRGDSLECYVDDQRVLAGKDGRRLKGYLGLRTWNEPGKYRNLQFTDAAGRVLWHGLPDLPATSSVVPPAPTIRAVPAPSSVLQSLRREDISPEGLAHAGDGDPKKAPPTLVAVLGTPESIHTARVTTLAFSRDGRWLASGSEDRTVHLRDAASGKVVRVLPGHHAELTCVGFSADGKTLISGDLDSNVKVWDLAEKREPTSLRFNLKSMQMAVSPDGRLVAAGGHDGKARLWHWGEWDRPISLPQGPGRIVGLAFDHDGSTLACAFESKPAGAIRLYRASDQTLQQAFDVQTHPRSLSFNHDGKYLASADDRQATIWSRATGKATDTGKRGLRVCFSPVVNRLAIFVNFDSLLHVLDVEAGSDVAGTDAIAWRGMIWSLAFSPDGKMLAVGDHAGAVNVYDSTTWRLLPRHIEAGHRNSIIAVAVSPDGRSLLSSGADNTLRMWDLAAPHQQRIFAENNSPYLVYSPDGKSFAAGGPDRPLVIRDAVTIAERSSLPIRFTNLAYSPDGKTIVGQGTNFDRLVHLWDIQLGKELHRFDFMNGGRAMTVSPDGALLVAGSQAGNVAVWNMTTGNELASWKESWTTSFAFSPDVRELAVGHNDGAISFWDTVTWKKSRMLRAHSGPVACLRYTPDGKRFLSSARDGVIQIRDPEHERPRAIIPVGPERLHVTFDVDVSGQYLFASGPTSVIYVHRLPSSDGALR